MGKRVSRSWAFLVAVVVGLVGVGAGVYALAGSSRAWRYQGLWVQSGIIRSDGSVLSLDEAQRNARARGISSQVWPATLRLGFRGKGTLEVRVQAGLIHQHDAHSHQDHEPSRSETSTAVGPVRWRLLGDDLIVQHDRGEYQGTLSADGRSLRLEDPETGGMVFERAP